MRDWFRNLFHRKPAIKPAEVKPDLIEDSIARIAAFLKQWLEQKLYDVYAFCSDGMMEICNPCCCLLGVFGSSTLHVCCADRNEFGIPFHYLSIQAIPEMKQIETAYLFLGFQALDTAERHEVRDRRLLEILGAEMARRAIAGTIQAVRLTPRGSFIGAL